MMVGWGSGDGLLLALILALGLADAEAVGLLLADGLELAVVDDVGAEDGTLDVGTVAGKVGVGDAVLAGVTCTVFVSDSDLPFLTNVTESVIVSGYIVLMVAVRLSELTCILFTESARRDHTMLLTESPAGIDRLYDAFFPAMIDDGPKSDAAFSRTCMVLLMARVCPFTVTVTERVIVSAYPVEIVALLLSLLTSILLMDKPLRDHTMLLTEAPEGTDNVYVPVLPVVMEDGPVSMIRSSFSTFTVFVAESRMPSIVALATIVMVSACFPSIVALL